MNTRERSAFRKQFDENTFRLRDVAERYESEAVAAGRRTEAISWGARVRKLDKEIAKYGLVRDAARS